MKLRHLVEDRTFHAHETARMDELEGLPLATFKRRAYAIAIDVVIIAMLKTPFGFLKHHEVDDACVTGFMAFMAEIGHKLLDIIEASVFFAVLLKIGKGQTPGKWFMKIRVVSLAHHEITWWQAIERALGYGASLLEGGFGFLQYCFHRNRQCVHDRIAETIVVDLRPKAVIDADPSH